MEIEETDITDLYVNPGRSANNSNYVFEVSDTAYLYRVPGSGSGKFTSRKREIAAYELLKPYNITDEIVYMDESGSKVTIYYKDSRIPNNNEKDLKASMMALKHLHKLNLDFDFEDSIFDRVKRYHDFAVEVGGSEYFLAGFDKYFEYMFEFEKEYQAANYPKHFVHGDASINNLLFVGDNEEPLLIDLEFPSKATAFEDIAIFCVDADFRSDQIILMLEYYLEREATETEKYYILNLAGSAALMWYGWAAYKCSVEEDNQQFIDFRDDYQSYIEDILTPFLPQKLKLQL